MGTNNIEAYSRTADLARSSKESFFPTDPLRASIHWLLFKSNHHNSSMWARLCITPVLLYRQKHSAKCWENLFVSISALTMFDKFVFFGDTLCTFCFELSAYWRFLADSERWHTALPSTNDRERKALAIHLYEQRAADADVPNSKDSRRTRWRSENGRP